MFSQAHGLCPGKQVDEHPMLVYERNNNHVIKYILHRVQAALVMRIPRPVLVGFENITGPEVSY